METIVLKRIRTEGDATIGLMSIGSICVATLEDLPQEIKISGKTRIPTGTYELKLRNVGGMTKKYADRYGDMHKGMIWLQNVPGFTFVYIHTGNYASHSEGCILVGMRAGGSSLIDSRKAYKLIYPKIVEMIDQEGCEISIFDEDGS